MGGSSQLSDGRFAAKEQAVSQAMVNQAEGMARF
jgi:hypothetical protein